MSRGPGLSPLPLLDLIELRAAEAGISRHQFVHYRFGPAAERNWWRWKNGQGLDHQHADEICHTLGVHPNEVWPEWDTPPKRRARAQHA